MLTDDTRALLVNCVFPLSLESGNTFLPVGVLFFVSPVCAVTARHNVASKSLRDTVYYKRPQDRKHAQLTLCFANEHTDLAILQSERPVGSWLPLLDTRLSPPLSGTNFLLAAYQVGIAEELAAEFKLSFGLMQASVTKTSKNHMIFQSTTFAGDSGAALTLMNGNVIGLHVEGVNEARERMTQKKDFDRLNEVEQSIDALVKGTAQGCIGLLAHVAIEALKSLAPPAYPVHSSH